jgi:hypothetical protein
MGKKPSQTIPLPDESWKQDFRGHTFRTSFVLTLSQSMIEFLCAVADDVSWDRSLYCTIYKPDHFITCERALEKRGLIRRKPPEVTNRLTKSDHGIAEISFSELTPAGKALVDLFKVTGVFVQAEAAMFKKSKRA